MALLDSTVGLIYSIKADGSDARKGVSDLRKHIDHETKQIEEDGSNAFLTLGKNIGLTDDQLVGLGKTLPVVGTVASVFATGVIAVATAAVSAASALFKLSTEAADYGSEIFDASEKTGLTAETLSSLKFAADQSGSSLEQVTGAITKFSKLVGEAAQGSEDAKNKLIAFGIDPQEAINDLDGALEKVFKRIVELPPGIQQVKAAQDAFGKSGADLLPFIKSFDGDMKGLIKTAKDLGVTINDEAAAAADEFGDQLDQTNAQIKGIANTIGLEFLPIFLDAAKSVSAWIKENRGDIKTWAQNSSDLIRGLVAYWTDLKNAVQGYTKAFNESRFSQSSGITAQSIYDPLGVTDKLTAIGKGLVKRGRAERKGSAESELGANLDTSRADYLQDLERQKQAAEKAAAERKTAAEKLLADKIKYNQILLKNEETLLSDLRRINKQYLDEFSLSRNEYLTKDLEDIDKYKQKVLSLMEAGFALASGGKKGQELKNLQAEYDASVKAFEKKIVEIQGNSIKNQEDNFKQELENLKKFHAEKIAETETNNKETLLGYRQMMQRGFLTEREFALLSQKLTDDLFEQKKKNLEDERELAKENGEAEKKIIEEQRALEIERGEDLLKQRELWGKWLDEDIDKSGKILEIEQRISEEKERQQRALDIAPRPGYDANGNETTTAPTEGGIFGGGAESLIGGLFDIEAMTQQVDVMQGLGQILADTFNTVAQAVGEAVRSFVLFGSAGGSFRKFAAEVIASVAQMAVVQAVWELAQGFAMMALSWFTGNPKYAASAGAHFQAAAVYGIVGGIATIAGRGIAGNAFQQQASGSAISGSSGGTSSGGGGNGATAYSSYGDKVTTVENDRNRASETTSRIKIELDQGLIARVIREDANNNGPIRQTLISVQQGI